MMDLKNLKALIKLMVENDLTELDLQDAKGGKVALKRGRAAMAPLVTAATPAMPMAGITVPVPAPAAAPAAKADASAADAGLKPINSPMVGTFYAAANPDAKPFVSVGAKVGPETVIGIIEAMKVFNEIKAETSGTVQKILVSSGQSVEFGQPMFLIQPDA